MNDASRATRSASSNLLAALDLICDEQIGIVRQVDEVKIEPGAPRFFHYTAQAANTRAFVGQRNFHRAGGAALTRAGAITKAVGEAVERYCAAIYEPAELPLTSAHKADFATVPPADFALHSAAQYAAPDFPWRRFTDDATIRWTPAVNATSGETRHMPAAFVWIPYGYDRESGETPIGQPISTGLACHGSGASASLSGLCEVIERDCFSIAWQAQCAPPQVSVETLPDECREMVSRLEAPGDRVVIADVTSDNGVWCFLAILCSEVPRRPAYVFAASANPDPAIAARKALEELAHTRFFSAHIKRALPPLASSNGWASVVTQLNHLAVAGDHANRDRFTFILGSRKRTRFADYESLTDGGANAMLAVCVERIVATGHQVYIADLTSEDVRGLGLHVHRVVVPGYHPLFMGYSQRALGGRRLYEVPQRLGQSGISAGQDNPTPHPYP